MFKSLYRIQQYPDRRFGEAVLNGKGVVVMLLIFISEQFIALGVNIMLYYINTYFGKNYDVIELNLFTDLATLALMIFFFGRFFWENLRSFFKEFKAVYIAAPILCYIGAMFGNYIVQIILMMIRGSSEQTSNNELVMQLVEQQPLTLVFLTVIMAPLTEEAVFRGALCRPMTASKNYFVKSLGFIISTLLFAFMHVYQYAFSLVADEATGALHLVCDYNELLSILAYIPMAIGFAVCSYVCKNYWGSVICHMITNGVSVSLMLLLSLLRDYLV